jgi:iron complex transport system ATP-binding protein
MMAKYRILILDEPCAGLDPVARERFLDVLSFLFAMQPAV